jgi:hypothetical protein
MNRSEIKESRVLQRFEKARCDNIERAQREANAVRIPLECALKAWAAWKLSPPVKVVYATKHVSKL